MYQEHEIDSRLTRWFEAFGEIPPPDERRRYEQREYFLAQVRRIALTAPRVAASKSDGWVLPLHSLFNDLIGRKTRFKFVTVLAAVIIMLIFAGSLTTFAAQSSLPDQPLYPLKLWSEAIRLNAAGLGQDWQLALEFTERRATEIRQIITHGQPLPETLQIRLMLQMDQALQLAVSRPNDEARQALEQVRLRLEVQAQEMVMSQGGFGPQANAALIRARETIRERICWIESGIQEPNQLREHFRLRLQRPEIIPGTQEQHRYLGTAAPGDPNRYDAGECPNCTPQGPQNGGNPWSTGTTTPGCGYGEGLGGNPWTAGTPTPGSGYGPGPNPNPTTTPPGNDEGSGQGTGCTPDPSVDPGSGPGKEPTEDSGGGSESQPTDAGQSGGGQSGQGGNDP